VIFAGDLNLQFKEDHSIRAKREPAITNAFKSIHYEPLSLVPTTTSMSVAHCNDAIVINAHTKKNFYVLNSAKVVAPELGAIKQIGDSEYSIIKNMLKD
jgi:hypothetical protein